MMSSHPFPPPTTLFVFSSSMKLIFPFLTPWSLSSLPYVPNHLPPPAIRLPPPAIRPRLPSPTSLFVISHTSFLFLPLPFMVMVVSSECVSHHKSTKRIFSQHTIPAYPYRSVLAFVLNRPVQITLI